MLRDKTFLKLTELITGDEKEIKIVDGCLNFRLRMEELGIREGSKIKILNKGKFGPILVSVNGNKFGIGRNAANNILI